MDGVMIGGFSLAQIETVWDRLTDQERNVLNQLYGLHGYKSLSAFSVGQDLGLTELEVRQIETDAIGHLATLLGSGGRTAAPAGD